MYVTKTKQDIDEYVHSKKQHFDVHFDQKKKDADLHFDHKKQDFVTQIDHMKKNIDVHIDKYIQQKKKNVTDFRRSESSPIQEEKYTGFQKDLIEFYRQEHSIISVSPLVEEHEVQLVEFYVKPQLVAVDLQQAFGNPFKTPVLSYEQLFCQGMGKVNKNIYVTSSAGMGKTSICKHICMTWCQAHDPDRSINTRFKQEDIRAMLSFKFLFYITLRDVHRSQCHLDDLIESLIKEILPKQSDHLLRQILDDKPCLVVIDGLDEWIHPDKCDRRKNDDDIPHRKYRKNWTIITTTRSWKFEMLHLASNQIDSHIELNELDEISSNELVQNAINVLNKKFKSGKTVEEFYSTTSQLKLGEIREIPYLHLHCLCLWYDGRNIGNSKCEIYSNILELTLYRGSQKLQFDYFPDPTKQESSFPIPMCMEDNEYCVRHQSLLLKIGQLAFHALFGSRNKQMLVFDYKFATNYLKPEELKYCLTLGLISQNKVYGSVSRRINNISFQHKTIQEYLAAFYLQSVRLKPISAIQYIHQLFARTCSSLSRILEMSEVFTFLSGFRSEAYRKISWNLINTVNKDEQTQSYRSRFSVRFDDSGENVMLNYQTHLVDCVEEMNLNAQDFYHPPLRDIIINEQSKQAEYMFYIQKLIQGNYGRIKSLYVRDCENTEEVTYILKRLDLKYFRSMEKLDLTAVVKHSELEILLNQSVNTLKCLVICNVNYNQGRFFDGSSVFSQICLDTVVSMPLLKSISLIYLKVAHNQLRQVTAFLTSRVKMIQIYMHNIACSDHGMSCPGVQFQLSKHEKLQLFGLDNVPVSQLQVNTQHLEECWIGGLSHRVITSCLTSLPAAHNLHTLSFSNLRDPDITSLTFTLPALSQLEELYIRYTDIFDKQLNLNAEMTNLIYIEMIEVSMTSSSFQSLCVKISFLSQSVTIHLRGCTVTPNEEYQKVKDNMIHSDLFTVIFDEKNRSIRQDFMFKTIK